MEINKSNISVQLCNNKHRDDRIGTKNCVTYFL